MSEELQNLYLSSPADIFHDKWQSNLVLIFGPEYFDNDVFIL